MNAISYLNGDTEITDFPNCSAQPLARLVQMCNDELAGGIGKPLQPQDALRVLTMGTGDAPPEVHNWYAQEVLGDNFGFAAEPSPYMHPGRCPATVSVSYYRARQYCGQNFNVDFLKTLLELTDRTITAWRQKMGLPPRPPLTTQELRPALTEMSQTS